DTYLFNRHYLQRMADEHRAGTKDHSTAQWAVLMFEAFQRKNGATGATSIHSTTSAASSLIASAA
ncbi:hypothetical protein, partial [Achromobacter sp. GbtcB20]|uniref:hypothetical protein n=1 Tax=Achromobacter sp. GbtcB20 TaxID=2824765 RepID=UPI001C30D58A